MEEITHSWLKTRQTKLMQRGYSVVYEHEASDYVWCLMVREPCTVHYLREWANGDFQERDIPITSKVAKRKEWFSQDPEGKAEILNTIEMLREKGASVLLPDIHIKEPWMR